MPTFKLDGKDIPFEPGESIIKAASRQGVEIPHYCWHAGLTAPANCRMCLVELKPAANQRAMMLDIVEWDPVLKDYKNVQKPKLQPACQYPATEGQEVLADTSKHVLEARASVQEFLLLNHPVDCPICDQAGECKLQDYWLEHQAPLQQEKRMRDEPIHKPKAVVFGPTIVYDAERCVMCTRCIRFMDEVAKDPVLEMRERGNLNEIFVAPGRQLEGHYTFMTEHVCPVGALTTKDFRFKARVWFLKSASSVCQGCATGCNAHLDFDPRSNKAYRYRPRDNEAVNKYWMCDEGMLTYRAAHEGRVIEARIGRKKAGIDAAIKEAKKRLGDVPREAIAVVLSAQHSLEDNWAMRELGTLLGAGTVYVAGAGTGYADDILIDADKNPNTAGVKELAPRREDVHAAARRHARQPYLARHRARRRHAAQRARRRDRARHARNARRHRLARRCADRRRARRPPRDLVGRARRYLREPSGAPSGRRARDSPAGRLEARVGAHASPRERARPRAVVVTLQGHRAGLLGATAAAPPPRDATAVTTSGTT